MLCSTTQLVNTTADWEDIKPLPCRRWSCEYCAPKRRRQLMFIAAAGEPTACLTITVNVAVGASPDHRRDLLHDAWKRFVKRTLRQFALIPEQRWQVTSKTRAPRREAIVRAITARTKQSEYKEFHYFAFLERTKRGEPHLHVLIRAPFIPQDWISEQFAALLKSPIVWIEKINNTKAAIKYVTKYVTKEPAQFGNKKRYWRSRHYVENVPQDADNFVGLHRTVSFRRRTWEEQIDEWRRTRPNVELLVDGWIRVWTNRAAYEHASTARAPPDA